MDRLHLMTVFVAVGEEQSYAGAARRLAMSPPAVTRAVAALEARQRYLDDARRVIAAADEADESAGGVNAAPRGHLAVTAPVLFGKLFVMPGIVDYLQRYPATDVSALFVDRVVNLLEEGLDAGIRIGALPDSSMQAVGVGHVRRVVCAAPAYLERHGAPLQPADLERHVTVAASGVTPSTEWKFERAGQGQSVRLTPRLVVTSNDGAIEVLLEEFEPPGVPVSVVHREGRHSTPKLRTFLDLIIARLRAEKALQKAAAICRVFVGRISVA